MITSPIGLKKMELPHTPVWKQSQLISFYYEILDAESDKPEALDNSLIEHYRNAFQYNWDHYLAIND